MAGSPHAFRYAEREYRETQYGVRRRSRTVRHGNQAERARLRGGRQHPRVVFGVHPLRNCKMDARDQNGRHQEHGELNVKITAVRAHALTMPVEQPLWTAQEALKDSSLVLVEIDAGIGLTGYGIIHGSPLKTIAEWVTRFGELIR